MDALKEGRILALECIIRSQLVDRALENSSPVTWLHRVRDSMRGPLQSAQSDRIPSNQAVAEGGKALDELFRQAEIEVNASLERTPREFPCD